MLKCIQVMAVMEKFQGNLKASFDPFNGRKGLQIKRVQQPLVKSAT